MFAEGFIGPSVSMQRIVSGDEPPKRSRFIDRTTAFLT